MQFVEGFPRNQEVMMKDEVTTAEQRAQLVDPRSGVRDIHVNQRNGTGGYPIHVNHYKYLAIT